MIHLIKMAVGLAFEDLVSFARNKLSEKKPRVFTEENSPELIKAVTEEMRAHDAHMILGRLQDIEKALYHVAGKQQEILVKQHDIEEVVVRTATCVEEMAHGIDTAMNSNEDDDEPTDEEFIADAWDGKKSASVVN